MKKALILHGTNGNSQHNWFPWLKMQLESHGYTVWVPDLPQAETPNIKQYIEFIFNNKDWVFDDETILIGHSSGAVSILGLLQALPDNIKVRASYLIGSFKGDLGMEALKDFYFEPLDFDRIKKHSRLFYFIHSDDDPYCPLSHAEYLHNQIGGDLIVLPGQKHFSLSTYGEAYRQFPYLSHLILGDVMTESEVVELYSLAEEKDIKLWIDGGWGVDALLEKQTRVHSDLDIVIQEKDVPAMLRLLEQNGYHRIRRGDETSWNFLVGDDQARFIDFHVINLDENGNGMYGPKRKGVMYHADALTGRGKVGNLTVRCISPEWLVKFHTGYDLRNIDYLDVKALCEKFRIELPEEHWNKA